MSFPPLAAANAAGWRRVAASAAHVAHRVPGDAILLHTRPARWAITAAATATAPLAATVTTTAVTAAATVATMAAWSASTL